MTRRFRPLSLLALLPMVALVCAQGVAGEEEAPLFASNEPLEVVLTIPVAQLRAQKSQRERLYLEGQWAYRQPGEGLTRLSLKVRARGNFRLQNCYFPPLRLNFLKKQVKETLFDGQDKLKLVSSCNPADKYEQFVLLEYLAYRLYNTLTDRSFRVRPLTIHFVDAQSGEADRNVFGFLIEEEEAMVERLAMSLFDANSVAPDQLDPSAAARVELFEYMIGNNDYSLVQAREGEKCCHNARLVASPGVAGWVPVPYDFDFSGIVNAPYAAPPSGLPIKSVRMRYFTGICKEEAIWSAAVERFNQQRPALFSELRALATLDEANQRRTADYLDRFYNIINDPKRLRREILEMCRS